MAGAAPCMADAEFDIEAAIAGFMANPAQASLELPCMSAAQRKQAKKLADQHPELKCESYGFGAERQLHLFKVPCAATAPAAAEPRAVRVKNTFIDDWVAAEGGEGAAEPIVFRSMPTGLSSRGLLPSSGEGDSPVDSARWGQSQQQPVDTSPVCSTAASIIESSPLLSTDSGSSLGSPVSSNREPPAVPELPTLPEGVEVRNTFIHFEETTADERVVQSMPHGMFRQCLMEEAAQQADVSAQAQAAQAATAAAPEGVAPIGLGTEVIIDGLTKFPAFNGLRGVVKSMDDASGRYNVLFLTPVGPGGHQWAKVKAENLRMAPALPPPPPCFAPQVVCGR